MTAATLLLTIFQLTNLGAQQCPEPEPLGVRLEKAIHRSSLGSTQGLVFHSGSLYESSGGYGQSSFNRINPGNGEVKQLARLDRTIFAEGLDIWKGKFLLLTWKEKKALLWNLDSTTTPRMVPYFWEGWGLTHDHRSWIVSDGTAQIRFLDPATLKETRSITVQRRADAQESLNELEYVNGRIFANIFKTDQIVRINPATGCVDGSLDLSSLKEQFTSDELSADSNAVANGIAYDPVENVFYLTGKNWPLIFKVEVIGN